MGTEQFTRRRGSVAGGEVGEQTISRYREVVLTNTQILNLRATPISLVPAPGTHKVALFDHAILVSNAAAGAYTETTDNLVIRQTGTTGVIMSDTIETTGWLDQAAIKANTARRKLDIIGFVKNAALVLHNSGDGEFGGGNAANTLRVRIYYTIQDLRLYGTLA